ncbi:PH domain-containing protein [Agromyces endophyticus]|uniref:PH domain-containing protein n=1 Tax=Agromyces sp. H17E-10 TaxID=2932244 RepID=UPI001FD24ADB|nr:PH domain-containing protein [Agromyces sp. H17E-10]UOQ90586.1 PH domain-containing protein [Agromyces sp. H17E-10]
MGFFDPHVERHLIADEGEVIVDEVTKHWAANVAATLEMLAAIPVLLLLNVLPSQLYFIPIFGALYLVLDGLRRILGRRMDRFVVTNMRVFRVHGILAQRIATMPLTRILDISVHKPIIGRVLNYGHFIFESAAQDQGLREIRFVGSPDQRGLTIQRVIQRAGLRGGGRGGAASALVTGMPQQDTGDQQARSGERGGRTFDDGEARTQPVPIVNGSHQGWLSTSPTARNDTSAVNTTSPIRADGTRRDQGDTSEAPWWRPSD